MVVRLTIMWLSPERPEWIDHDQDVLQYRLDKWAYGIKEAYARGLSLEAVQRGVGKGIVTVDHIAEEKELAEADRIAMEKADEADGLLDKMGDLLIDTSRFAMETTAGIVSFAAPEGAFLIVTS